jgi:hypothetical protein
MFAVYKLRPDEHRLASSICSGSTTRRRSSSWARRSMRGVFARRQ